VIDFFSFFWFKEPLLTPLVHRLRRKSRKKAIIILIFSVGWRHFSLRIPGAGFSFLFVGAIPVGFWNDRTRLRGNDCQSVVGLGLQSNTYLPSSITPFIQIRNIPYCEFQFLYLLANPILSEH
jgi:hypothetical protein